MNHVGKIMSDLRTEKEMGQKELAALLNLSLSTISNYETGVHSPDFDTLRKVADLFHVTVDYLLGRTGFRCSLEELKEYITPDYTVCNFIDAILPLDTASQTFLLDFALYLQECQTESRPN